jgi:hypothetical protein
VNNIVKNKEGRPGKQKAAGSYSASGFDFIQDNATKANEMDTKIEQAGKLPGLGRCRNNLLEIVVSP